MHWTTCDFFFFSDYLPDWKKVRPKVPKDLAAILNQGCWDFGPKEVNYKVL